MKRIREFISTVRREAAIEAAKITFSIIGVGTVLGQFSVMSIWLLVPAFSLVSVTWFIIYRMCE